MRTQCIAERAFKQTKGRKTIRILAENLSVEVKLVVAQVRANENKYYYYYYGELYLTQLSHLQNEHSNKAAEN